MARRRIYNSNDDASAIGIFILWVLYSFYSFIKMNLEVILIGGIILIVASILIVLIANINKIKKYFYLKRKNKIINKLMKKSLLYKNICVLNKGYKYDEFSPFYDHYQVFFKSNLQTCNIDDYLLMTINSKYEQLKKYKLKYDELREKCNEYDDKYQELKKYIDINEADELKINHDEYLKYQNEIFSKYKRNNKPQFKVIIYINYSSKKGRVKDNKYKVYTKCEFLYKMNEYLKLKRENKLSVISSRVERSKMSESLRYDILKRDGFRCQICGASQKDGVKLQVDHIIPVSKGGKTIKSNLQTLCSRCNIGKSNKF